MNKTVIIHVNLEDNKSGMADEAFEKVEAAIMEYNTKGYKVLSVTPLTGSNYYYNDEENYSYGYGYSFTAAIIIVFEEYQFP